MVSLHFLILFLDLSNHLQMVLMSKLWDRSKALLSLEQEVERQTTEEQVAENEGHEQFKETQRIEAAAKVQGGTGAANNVVDFEELKKKNVVVMTLITTVTFAAAFQVPGGYDGNGKANLVKSRDFRNFLIFDSCSFGTSAASLIFMFLAFSAGVAAVLDEKSSLYSLTNITVVYVWALPILLYGIFYSIFIIPLTYFRNKLLPPFRS